jgi:acyl carrier protein
MTSSLASLIGDVGRLEYCAANSYLDVISNLETKNIDNLISINWLSWSNIGMSIKSNVKANLSKVAESNNILNIISKNSVTEDEGAKIFYKLINQKNFNQIAISKIDILKLKQELFKSITNSDIKFYNNESTNILIEENATELENKIAQVFYQVLGNHKFSKYDNYFELGGDSLSAIRLANKLNNNLNINITMALILKQNTVAKLANHISSSLLVENNQLDSLIDEGEL